MAKTILDGVAQLHYVPTIADPSAPTLTEIQGGVDLSGFLRPGGDWSPIEGSTVDAATIDSAFNSTARGTYGGQPFAAVFTNDDTPGGDVAWNTLPRGTTGYFVVSFYGGSGPDGALAVGDIVNVYAIDVYTRKRSPYARNELAVFTVEAAVTEPPHEDVAIVSS